MNSSSRKHLLWRVRIAVCLQSGSLAPAHLPGAGSPALHATRTTTIDWRCLRPSPFAQPAEARMLSISKTLSIIEACMLAELAASYGVLQPSLYLIIEESRNRRIDHGHCTCTIRPGLRCVASGVCGGRQRQDPALGASAPHCLAAPHRPPTPTANGIGWLIRRAVEAVSWHTSLAQPSHDPPGPSMCGVLLDYLR